MEENTNEQSQGIQLPEGISAEEALAALETPFKEQEQPKETTSEPLASGLSAELTSRLQRLEIKVEDLPTEIPRTELALDKFVSTIEKRERELQAIVTRKSQDISDKAKAFDVLVADSGFQTWVDTRLNNMRTGGNTMELNNPTNETPPAGLEGEALLNWYIEKKADKIVESKLQSMGITTAVSNLSNVVSQTQRELYSSKYGDFWTQNEQAIISAMRNNNMNADEAVRFLKSSTFDEAAVKQKAREEVFAEIKRDVEKARGSGGTLTSSRTGTVSARDVKDMTFDEAFDIVASEVTRENPIEILQG